MRYLVTLFTVLALALTACAEGNGGASPGVDDDPIFTPGTTGMDDPDASPTETPGEAGAGASPGATGDDDGTSPSPDATESPDATGSPGATDDDDGSPGASPSPRTGTGTGTGTAAACEDAFADVPDLTRMTSLRDLQAMFAAIDETIEACDSVDEWTEQAEQNLGMRNLSGDAESFLRDRCEDDDLEDTAICEEVSR